MLNAWISTPFLTHNFRSIRPLDDRQSFAAPNRSSVYRHRARLDVSKAAEAAEPRSEGRSAAAPPRSGGVSYMAVKLSSLEPGTVAAF